MAKWEIGYAINKDGKLVYWSLDCPHCNGIFKAKTEEEINYWKNRFKFCPFCGEPMEDEEDEQIEIARV